MKREMRFIEWLNKHPVWHGFLFAWALFLWGIFELLKTIVMEKFASFFVRLIVFAVAAMFLLYAFVWKQPCDGIDNEFLSCRLTGTWGDIIGGILFVTGLLILSGFVTALSRGFKYLYNPPNSSTWNIAVFVGMVLGAILIWFA